jgi:site-specific DNA-methyltransferase (adenine-specific)
MKDSKLELLQGDCLELLPTLPDKSIDCIIADLPYNIKADKWDEIKNYVGWLKKAFAEFRRVLKDNGSLYWFHSEMKVVSEMMVYLEKETDFIFRQFIVWNKRFEGSKNKGYLDGFLAVDELRNYQQMAEYILFYTLQDETGLSKIMGHCIYPVREYIRNEIIRAKGKIVLSEINKVLGTATNGGGVASACLSTDKTCPAMITKEHYEKLRLWLNVGKEYEFLRKEYEFLRKEYEFLRYTFNNQKTHHSVWNYDISATTGHATPKPIDLIKTILRHSTRVGDTVLDPTAGSGSTIKACRDLQRNCIAIEMSERYCKKIRKQIINQMSLSVFETQTPQVILSSFEGEKKLEAKK